MLRNSIGLSGVQNARELGGYRSEDGRVVKGGVLLRTARLSTGTEEDLKRLKEVYHLAKIIDLRSDEEIYGSEEIALFTGSKDPDPDPEIEGAEYINLQILDLKKMMVNNTELMKEIEPPLDFIQMLNITIKAGFINDELYFGFLDEEPGRSSYSRFMRELMSLEEGKAVLFHCTQGKDRTGVGAMLILSALDVPEKVIVEDYVLTNDYNSEKIAKERMMLEMSGKVPADQMETYLMAMDRVNEKTMTNVIAYLKKKYGSVKNYIISGLGISEQELKEFKDKFLAEG